MPTRNICSLLFCFQLSYLTLIGQTLDPQADDLIRSKAEAYAVKFPGVVVCISRKDQFIDYTFGYANIKKQIPVTEETKFNLYSTSKLITGLAYLRLFDQGKTDGNIRARDLDPTLPNKYKDITIQHLLTHRSGIRHYKSDRDWEKFNNLRCLNPSDAMQHFINDPLKSKPGIKKIYSTYGLVLASHLLERITETSFEEAINAILPFSDSLLLDDPSINKAIPYSSGTEGFVEIANLNARCKFGGGGFVGSARQLAEAGRFLYDGSLASLAATKEMCKSQWETGSSSGTAFAMGIGLENEDFGQPDVLYVTMSGSSPGGRSYLFVVADLQIAVAITANCDGDSQEAFQLAYDIVQIVMSISN